MRISNTYSEQPLVIGSAHIARRAVGSSIQYGTDRVLTFDGHLSYTVPPGATVLSDPVDLDVEALSDLAVSIYLPGSTRAETSHFFALQTSYLSPPGEDRTAAAEIPDATTMTSWPFVTGVDVGTDGFGSATVAVGDSIADGAASTVDANQRWPDLVAARLQQHRRTERIAVLNQGSSATECCTRARWQTLSRRGWTRTSRSGRPHPARRQIRHRALWRQRPRFSGSVTHTSEQVSASDLIAGYREIIESAHQKGVRALGSTITPFEIAQYGEGFYTSEKERIREGVNDWIRASGELDGVIDFDQALRDRQRRVSEVIASLQHL